MQSFRLEISLVEILTYICEAVGQWNIACVHYYQTVLLVKSFLSSLDILLLMMSFEFSSD